jgi:hypothetical protein
MKHKKQHFIPKFYLEAWCDPKTPAGQEPFVWQFPKEGGTPQKKAPKNIFHETDMYTVKMPDGSRNLVLEEGLSQLEYLFVKLTNEKLSACMPLENDDRLLLCAFVAAMTARTEAQRNHWSKQWGELLRRGDEMIEWAKTASEEDKRAASLLAGPEPKRGTFTYKDIKRLAESPMQNMLIPMISVMTPLFFGLNLGVLYTDSKPGFITSDNPVVWFDPDWHTRPPFWQDAGLAYPKTEITLPVSPSQLVILSRRDIKGYLPIPERVADDLSRRTRFRAHKHFIVNDNVQKPIWFDPGVEPEDSWRKKHKPEA